jgi:glycosyltransferase involved in cell wall biosynthesis
LRGGIARTTTALARTLAARGALSVFVVPQRQYPSFLYPGAADTDADACPRLDVAESLFAVVEPWTWDRAARRVARADPDCLVLPHWTWVWAPFELHMLGRTRARAVAIVHNPADHDASPVARRASRLVLGRCSGFLCHATSVAQQLEGAYPGVATAVHPLPSDDVATVDRQSAREALGVPGGAVAALFFGLIRPYKGVDVLLDALAMMPSDSPLVLLLAGEPWGELSRAIERRLAERGLGPRVIARLGWIPERESATWFAAADFAVLPYRSATGSAVAAQAMAFGLPVVGSRVGGIAEVVEEGVSGYLVPPGDPGALAMAMGRACRGDERANLAGGARAAAARWSWGSYADALQDLVTRVRGTAEV